MYDFPAMFDGQRRVLTSWKFMEVLQHTSWDTSQSVKNTWKGMVSARREHPEHLIGGFKQPLSNGCPHFLKHAHNSGPNMNRSWIGTVSQGGCLDISYMNRSISCRFFSLKKNHRPVFSCNGSFHQQKGLKILDPQNLPFHSWRTSHFIRLMVNFPYFCEKKRHEIDASFSRKCCHVETQPKIAGFRGRLRCCLLSESGCKQPGIQTHGNPKFGTSKITELGCHLSSGMMVEWDEIGCKESQVQSIYCIQPPKKIINL